MTKVLEFTQEEKSLIWSTKVAPTGASPDDGIVFVNVCEEYGLNPLQGDVIFQRYETKFGPRVSYIVTRDGYLKHAHRQSSFISLNAGVVHANDTFEFDVNNEVVIHKFGLDRGSIIGAWAVLKTKNQGNILEFANYSEYQKALGEKNKLWNTMPSAMIKKVAQSNAIRMAFPLGVDFRSEDEMVVEEEIPTQSTEPTKDVPQTSNLQAELVAEKEKLTEKVTTPKETQKTTKRQPKDEKKEDKEMVKETSLKPSLIESPKADPKKLPINETESTKVMQEPSVKVEVQPEVEQKTPTEEIQPIEQEEKAPVQEVVQAQVEQVVSDQVDDNAYVFVDATLQIMPSNKKQFLKVIAIKNGVKEMLFAADDAMFAFDEFQEGTKFEADVQVQQNFKFVKGVKVIAA